MSSLRNAMKSQKVHRERHQPEDRKHLGPLEKKKDYKVRAKDQGEKKAAIKVLKKRALNKNPDEFHFHMINSELRNGIHIEKVENQELNIGDVSQDLNYITHRRSLERKKIEKLKATIHLLDTEEVPKNTHIIFVDTEKDVRKANPAKMLDTHPSLLNRTFNRLRTAQLSEFSTDLKDPEIFKNLSQAKKSSYKELARRLERENKLRILQEKLEVRKRLMNDKKKNRDKPKLIAEGTSNTAPVYQWSQERTK